MHGHKRASCCFWVKGAGRKLQFTDDLIDQIVYRLYGLTEDEIAIAEGWD